MSVIHIVAGPTASGKSARAMELARELGRAVIINADSLQIYSALATLTAQPSKEDRVEIPHVLYAHLHPNDTCSAGNWRTLAMGEIEKALSSGQTPIVCGGTGLYIKSLMQGLSPIPDIPQQVRDKVVALYEELGVPGFYEELKHRDPHIAEHFHPGHKARLMRAMEVLIATGKSLAIWQEAPLEGPPPSWEFRVEKILPERETLYARCNQRFEAMLKSGALQEVENFAARTDVNPGVPLGKALGYKELLSHLKGELSREEAITLAQGQTRRYAKRQVTWFRHQL